MWYWFRPGENRVVPNRGKTGRNQAKPSRNFLGLRNRGISRFSVRRGRGKIFTSSHDVGIKAIYGRMLPSRCHGQLCPRTTPRRRCTARRCHRHRMWHGVQYCLCHCPCVVPVVAINLLTCQVLFLGSWIPTFLRLQGSLLLLVT